MTLNSVVLRNLAVMKLVMIRNGDVNVCKTLRRSQEVCPMRAHIQVRNLAL
jgi:hypothetical protein